MTTAIVDRSGLWFARRTAFSALMLAALLVALDLLISGKFGHMNITNAVIAGLVAAPIVIGDWNRTGLRRAYAGIAIAAIVIVCLLTILFVIPLIGA